MNGRKRPRVALNAVAARPGGGLTYLTGQLPYLEALTDLTVYANPIIADELRRSLHHAEVRELPRWARFLPLRFIWEHVVFPLDGRDAEVLYSVGSFTSLVTRKPQVVVVLIPYIFGPEGRTALALTRAPLSFRVKSALQRVMGRATLRQATILVGASQFTAAQIRASARRPVQIRVVPLAGGILEVDPEHPAPAVGVNRPYALSVGSDWPQKDRLGLVDAWPREAPLDLVMVGRCDNVSSGSRLQAVIAGRDNVHWFRSVDDNAELSAFYQRATCVIAHSYIEGFGMTPLEAMAADSPVIASNIPAHWEVCGDAALYYDLYDPASLALCVQRLVEDAELAKQLVEAGRQRLKLFGWQRNAEETHQILLEAREGVVPSVQTRAVER